MDFKLNVTAMRFFSTLFFLFFSISFKLFAVGENCSSPKAVSVGCPAITMTGQSSVGMGNDIASWKYSSFSSYSLTGEDMVYELTLPSGITELIVSLNNVNKPAYLFTSTNCVVNGATIYPNKYITTGNNSNLSIAPPATGNIIYLHVDHSGTSPLTFDISFGAVTRGVSLNIPDTRGILEFVKTTCTNPSFLIPLDLYKDGSKLTNPAFFGPNNASHEFCFKLFIQNLTGKEGVKSFSFTFNTSGFNNVSVSSSSMPGGYSNGTWHASVTGNTVLWTYSNAADPYKGDYDDLTKNCLEYTFCMNATPINSTTQQSINIWVTGDGKTPGYTGFQYTGCCATNNCNLYGAEGYKGLAGTAFGGATTGAAGFGMAVGSAGLPLEMLDVWLENETLNWKTTHETKLSHHVVQYSEDGRYYNDLQNIAATGNDKSGLFFYKTNLTDLPGKGYLRIKSVDEDGSENFSKIIVYTPARSALVEVLLSPNPVKDELHIQASEDLQSMSIYNLNGTMIYKKVMSPDEHVSDLFYDFGKESKGIYTLQLITSKGVIQKQVVKD